MGKTWQQTNLIGELTEFEDFFPNGIPDKGYKAEPVAKWPWSALTAYYCEYNSVLSREVRLLEADFVNWYKQLSEPDRISWVKDMTSFDMHKRADDLYDEYSDPKVVEKSNLYIKQLIAKGGLVGALVSRSSVDKTLEEERESMRAGCFAVKPFVHWTDYAYLVEEVNEFICKGYSHDQYVVEKTKEEISDMIENMRSRRYGFSLSEEELSNEDILPLSRLYRFWVMQRNYAVYSRGSTPPGLQHHIQEKGEKLRATYENIKKTCTESELRAISIAYDAYLKKQKSKKKLSKHEQEVFPFIKEAYEVWNSADNKKNEIYKKAVRMPGHGFSKR